MYTNNVDVEIIRLWWFNKRYEYNKGLVMGGIIAFILYCILGFIIIEPRQEFELTLFTILYQGIAYIMLMALANVFYTLGSIADLLFNKSNSTKFREHLFVAGYWFSTLLPSLFVLGIMIYLSNSHVFLD